MIPVMQSNAHECLYNLQVLVLDRMSKSQNMSRFYVMRIEATLFGGDVGLVREWGRHGTRGKGKLEFHPDLVKAKESLETWLRRKSARGYQIRGGGQD